jgi:DNA modification methylase
MTATLYLGDCREVMASMGEASVDAIVCDPPYGLEFMGKEWDHGVPGVPFWTEALRVIKPGGHLLAFGGTRTFHRLTCAIEDAGFEIRDCLSWLYGSGFPKSLDVGKAIDRQRHDREEVLLVTRWIHAQVLGAKVRHADILGAFGFNEGSGMVGHWTATCAASQPAVPTLDQVPKLLDVLGDPDVPEEIAEILIDSNGMRGDPGEAWFRREVVGTKLAGIATPGDSDRHTVGGSRAVEVDITAPATEAAQTWEGWGTALKPAWEPIILARKPLVGTVAANVLAHGTGALNVDGCRVGTETIQTNRYTPGRDMTSFHGSQAGNDYVSSTHPGRWPANVLLDPEAAAMLDEQSGEKPSRFFYTAKTPSSERHGNDGANGQAIKNDHPTVKPVDLMAYLVKLVTPPGGTVLDPFTGSGSTGIAALRLGVKFLGIEREPSYLKIAEARIREDSPLFNTVEAVLDGIQTPNP